MPGEREAILSNLKTALVAIRKGGTSGDFTYNYTPTQVIRPPGFGDSLLDGNQDMVYMVVTGEEPDEPSASYTWTAQLEVFVLGFKSFEDDTVDVAEQDEVRDTIQNAIIDDMRGCLSPAALINTINAAIVLGGEVDNIDFADWRVGSGEYHGWVYVELRLLIEYDWKGVMP